MRFRLFGIRLVEAICGLLFEELHPGVVGRLFLVPLFFRFIGKLAMFLRPQVNVFHHFIEGKAKPLLTLGKIANGESRIPSFVFAVDGLFDEIVNRRAGLQVRRMSCDCLCPRSAVSLSGALGWAAGSATGSSGYAGGWAADGAGGCCPAAVGNPCCFLYMALASARCALA